MSLRASKRPKIALYRFSWLLVALIGACLWEIVARVVLRNRLLFPTLGDVFTQLVVGLFNGSLSKALLITILRAFASFSVGCIIGIPLGMLLGSIRVMRTALEGPLDFLRSIPVSAIIPALMILFGTTDVTRITAASWACTLAVLVNALYGASTANPNRLMVSRLFGANRWQQFSTVRFWEALPHLLAGMRMAISLSVVYTILAEILVISKSGLGRSILDASNRFDTSVLYAAILLAGLGGFGLNRLLLVVERRFGYW